jgi:hypothetical protein
MFSPGGASHCSNSGPVDRFAGAERRDVARALCDDARRVPPLGPSRQLVRRTGAMTSDLLPEFGTTGC